MPSCCRFSAILAAVVHHPLHGVCLDETTFAAQLDMLGHRPQLQVDTSTARQWAQAFLAACESHAAQAIDAERCGWYSACALLTLARGQMRHLRAGWPELARHCVHKAAAAMRRSTQVCS